MYRFTIPLTLFALVLPPTAWCDPLDVAARTYDLDLAQIAAADARTQYLQTQSDESRRSLVAALLLVAELNRIDFEKSNDEASAESNGLGTAIDAAAEEGMALAQQLPLASEKYRLLADLQATMIRSKYRAKRYQKRLQEFIDQAIALDEKNPLAWVSHAKPLVFADAEQGGDLDAGIASLDKALALAPGLESALLLKAHALDLKGDHAAAVSIWKSVLENNPDSKPARDALDAANG